MALLVEVPTSFPAGNFPPTPQMGCHDSDRLRCHSTNPTSQSRSLSHPQTETGPKGTDVPSSFSYYYDQQYEEPEELTKKTYPPLTSGKCDRKCCKVGRNSGRFRSFVRGKMNFIDVSRIRPAASTKMCMKTRLVGEDCKPLLIRGSDELMFPINDDVTNDFMTSHKRSATGKEPGRCRRFLDGLARTFCLPLLG